MELPKIDWVKNDPKKHQWFSDGSVFLVALQVGKTGGPYHWNFDVVKCNCDGDGVFLTERESGEAYSAWSWDDFEYFQLIEGEMPTARPDDLSDEPTPQIECNGVEETATQPAAEKEGGGNE